MATKQSSLSLSKKIEILAAVEKNERDKKTTKTKIAQTFGIAKTTLSIHCNIIMLHYIYILQTEE